MRNRYSRGRCTEEGWERRNNSVDRKGEKERGECKGLRDLK